jgi:prevent-host-death family protein
VDVSAAQFKAQCLKLMDQVERTRKPIVITKHGRPVAQLAPVPGETRSLFGYMKGTVRIEGNIVAPIDTDWSVLSGDEDHLFRAKMRSRRTRGK